MRPHCPILILDCEFKWQILMNKIPWVITSSRILSGLRLQLTWKMNFSDYVVIYYFDIDLFWMQRSDFRYRGNSSLMIGYPILGLSLKSARAWFHFMFLFLFYAKSSATFWSLMQKLSALLNLVYLILLQCFIYFSPILVYLNHYSNSIFQFICWDIGGSALGHCNNSNFQ